MDSSFSKERLFEIGTMDSLKSALWTGFQGTVSLKLPLWTGLFLRDGLFEIGPLDRSFSKERTF